MHEDRIKTLNSLIKLQEAEMERVQGEIAACVAEEAAIARQISDAEKSVAMQRDIASRNDLSSDNLLLQEAFRDWLPGVLLMIKQCEKELLTAQENTVACRENLIAINSKLETTKSVVGRLVEEDRIHRERKDQIEMDDISRALFLKQRKRKNILKTRQKQTMKNVLEKRSLSG